MSEASTQVIPGWLGDVPPEFEGGCGKAWRLTVAAHDEPDGGVGDPWLIFAPAAHPFWAWHMVMGISLRPKEGLPDPHLRYPDAEYELICMAMHPEVEAPDPREPTLPGALSYLAPPDVVVQFHDVPGGDVGVKELLGLVAQCCTDGRLVPDSDHARAWVRAITDTVRHARAGKHGLGPTE